MKKNKSSEERVDNVSRFRTDEERRKKEIHLNRIAHRWKVFRTGAHFGLIKKNKKKETRSLDQKKV